MGSGNLILSARSSACADASSSSKSEPGSDLDSPLVKSRVLLTRRNVALGINRLHAMPPSSYRLPEQSHPLQSQKNRRFEMLSRPGTIAEIAEKTAPGTWDILVRPQVDAHDSQGVNHGWVLFWFISLLLSVFFLGLNFFGWGAGVRQTSKTHSARRVGGRIGNKNG